MSDIIIFNHCRDMIIFSYDEKPMAEMPPSAHKDHGLQELAISQRLFFLAVLITNSILDMILS